MIFYLGWFAFLCAVTGQVLIIYKRPSAFIAWTIGESILGILAFLRGDYSEFAFFTAYVFFNIVGWVKWQKEAYCTGS